MKNHDHPSLPPGLDASRLVLDKVGSMVRGLFPAKERQIMLTLFEEALVFVTRDNIEGILLETPYLFTAWQIANLYLGSFGLPGLDDRPARLVGLAFHDRRRAPPGGRSDSACAEDLARR